MRMQEAYKAQHHWNLCRAALRYNHINVFLLCIFKLTQSLFSLCDCINDATKCRIMSNELMYWHTLIVHYGTRARFLNNNISRFESAFRCNCCHRCGSLSYSTMKSIDTSYTMNPCLSKTQQVPDKTMHKHTLMHYGKRQFFHDDHTGNNNYNNNCNCNYNDNCNYNKYGNLDLLQ